MRYIYTCLTSLILLSFTSCSAESVMSIGFLGIIALFALMFILFAVMFFLIARRKKQGEKSLAKFNNDVYIALEKLDTPQQKINMLNNLIKRINNDEKYKKDTDWRDKVLLKTYMHLAKVYYTTDNDIETLNACTKIIELDPKDGMAYYNRGSLYSRMGMYEKALNDLNQTIELLPDYASAYNNRGLVHEKMEHYTEALADFDKATELEDSPIVYFNRGNTYFEMEDYQNALNDYQTALENVTGDQVELKAEIELSINVVKEKLQKN